MEPRILSIHKDRVIPHRTQRFATIDNAVIPLQLAPGDTIVFNTTDAEDNPQTHTFTMVTELAHELIFEEVIS